MLPIIAFGCGDASILRFRARALAEHIASQTGDTVESILFSGGKTGGYTQSEGERMRAVFMKRARLSHKYSMEKLGKDNEYILIKKTTGSQIRLLVEGDSSNTNNSINESLRLLGYPEKVGISSSDFHVQRIKKCLERIYGIACDDALCAERIANPKTLKKYNNTWRWKKLHLRYKITELPATILDSFTWGRKLKALITKRRVQGNTTSQTINPAS